MNEVGVIHSDWQTCLEAAEVSQKPIVSSHSACAALNHHRCKRDEVMRAIDAMLDHIDHAVQVVGVEHVTISYRAKPPAQGSLCNAHSGGESACSRIRHIGRGLCL